MNLKCDKMSASTSSVTGRAYPNYSTHTNPKTSSPSFTSSAVDDHLQQMKISSSSSSAVEGDGSGSSAWWYSMETFSTFIKSHRKLQLLSILVMFPLCIYLLTRFLSRPIDNTFTLTSMSSSNKKVLMGDSSDPSISIYNEYTKDTPLSGYYTWTTIVEPYRTTYLTVTNPSSSYRYEWYIDGWLLDEGDAVSTTFTAPTGSSQVVTLKVYDSKDNLMTSKDTEVMCKYVRREIRSLLAQDRVAFFQAVSIMQRVPTQVGKAIYGDKYRSKDFFNRIHLYYGGQQDCDHWHIVSNHNLNGNRFTKIV